MKKILMTAVLATALTGATAFATDDAPDTTQPAVKSRAFVALPDGTTEVPLPDSAEIEKAIRSATQKMEKHAWLGVSTSPAPLALLKQLKIKSGLVIDSVVAGSPAEAAGVKPEDIIQKLDDQLLLNPAQLEGLIRTHDAGDTVTLSLLHEGDHTTAAAKLVEHDVLVAQDADPTLKMFPAAAFPLNGPENVKVFTDQASGNPNVHVHVFTASSSTGSNVNGVNKFQSQFSDGKYQLTMVRQGDRHILTIKDSDGKELFAGPVDTAAEQNVIPADLLPKFREMQKMEHMTDDVAKP